MNMIEKWITNSKNSFDACLLPKLIPLPQDPNQIQQR
jgi:hypothetical protein